MPSIYPSVELIADAIGQALDGKRLDLYDLTQEVRKLTAAPTLPVDYVKWGIQYYRRNLTGAGGEALIVRAFGWEWLYELTSDVAEITEWTRNRNRDAETRLGTMQPTALYAAQHSDRRSLDGRIAAKIATGVGRLLADIEELRREDAELEARRA